MIASLAGQPQREVDRLRIMVAAGLGEVAPGGDAQPRGQRLQHDRHQVRDQDDAQQGVAELANRRRGRWPSCPGPCSRPRPCSRARGRRGSGAASGPTPARARWHSTRRGWARHAHRGRSAMPPACGCLIGDFAIHRDAARRAGREIQFIANAMFQSKGVPRCGNLGAFRGSPFRRGRPTRVRSGMAKHEASPDCPGAGSDRRRPDRCRPACRKLPPGPRGAALGTGRGLRRADLGPDPRWRRSAAGRHRRAPGRRPADGGEDAQAAGEERTRRAEAVPRRVPDRRRTRRWPRRAARAIALVEAFLLALGIDADTARRDAEGIEHHVSRETLAAFARFVEAGAKKPS